MPEVSLAPLAARTSRARFPSEEHLPGGRQPLMGKVTASRTAVPAGTWQRGRARDHAKGRPQLHPPNARGGTVPKVARLRGGGYD